MSLEARKIRLIMHLRTSGVTDTAVLSAIERVKRERFVPGQFQDKAYDDVALPIGHGQTISQPLVVGLMTQALEMNDRIKALEIGTGSGYQAAVLARLSRRVYTIERHKPLLDSALALLHELRVHNVTGRVGDGTKGWPEQAPFERIIVTAGGESSEPPPELLNQLAVGGVMVIPLTVDGRNQKVVRFRRNEQEVTREDLWPVRFVPLLPEAEPQRRVRSM